MLTGDNRRAAIVIAAEAGISEVHADLRHLPRVLTHARRSHRIMRLNMGLSLLIVITLVPLAIIGALGLAAIVAIHEMAEIVVIGNGLRFGRTTTILEPMTKTTVTGLSIGQKPSVA